MNRSQRQAGRLFGPCLLMTKGHAAALFGLVQGSGASSPAGVGLEHVRTDDRGSLEGVFQNSNVVGTLLGCDLLR